jgi:O-methyltransferase involved in polyketide biosynthesis
MGVTLPTLTPLQETLWVTLCGRALDSRLPSPILGDRMAYEIIHKTGYDHRKLRWSAASAIDVAQRAKKLDEIAQRFIARHPDAIGIDLGAGLDTRALRIDPPSTADWYDVDFPEVVDARHRIIPERPHTHTIGADLTEPGWLEALPADRPAVIVADGVLPFLSQEEMITLLDRLTSHFPSGEIAFNVYTRFTVWAARHYSGSRFLVPLFKSPGFDRLYPVRWNPRLTLIRHILLTREPEVDQFPTALRLWTRLSALSAAFSRLGTTVAYYRF